MISLYSLNYTNTPFKNTLVDQPPYSFTLILCFHISSNPIQQWPPTETTVHSDRVRERRCSLPRRGGRGRQTITHNDTGWFTRPAV